MGMFDTILFDPPIPCPKCGAEITSDQTKAFECTLDEYRNGDCISHAEEIRVVRDELFCGHCKQFTEKYYYLAVYRGILAGIEQDLESAERRLRTFGFETLILWYHDMYAKLQQALGETHRADGFMREVCEWFEKGHDRMTAEERDKQMLFFLWNREILESSSDPLAALRKFLARREQEQEPAATDW